jgi:hypothetical protein
VDDSGLARRISASRSHVLGLLMRFAWPPARMPSADQISVNSPHSAMPWHEWVALIAESTGSALRAVRPSQLAHRASTPARPRSRHECDGFLAALPSAIMASAILALDGERNGRDLCWSPRQQPGRCLVPWILAREDSDRLSIVSIDQLIEIMHRSVDNGGYINLS